MKFKDYLVGVDACKIAREWNAGRTLSQCWKDCERGDWMLWLMKRSNMCDLRTLTLAKARCAELAKPYMKDQRSLAALQSAFDFANGLITEDELRTASAAAYAAYAAAAAHAAHAASDAAYAAAAHAAAYAAKRIEILKQCSDICREVLATPKIEKVDDN